MAEPVDNKGQVTWIEFEQDVELLLNEGAPLDARSRTSTIAKKSAHLITLICAAETLREKVLAIVASYRQSFEGKAENLRVCVFIPPAS